MNKLTNTQTGQHKEGIAVQGEFGEENKQPFLNVALRPPFESSCKRHQTGPATLRHGLGAVKVPGNGAGVFV